MALGVDTVAHQAALENGGKTIAILGCGVDIIYPPQNTKLYEQIVSGGGVVISEFPPGQTVLKGLFVARNRLISGLSAGIMVVEGLKNSGALITARYAAEQGKDVFAPPVPLTSPLSEAPNILLKQGAKLVTGVEDILEEYGIQSRPVLKNIVDGLSAEEQNIVRNIQEEPLIVDEIAIRLQEPVTSVLNTLSVLEISGVVKKNMEGKYELAL
jgi:DNA processing protein